MKKKRGQRLYLIDDVDELTLELTDDADLWINKRFVLTLNTCAGEEIRIDLDGLHVSDLVDDAFGGGIGGASKANSPSHN